LSSDNKFALEKLAAFIFRVSEVQVAAASVHNNPSDSENVDVAQQRRNLFYVSKRTLLNS
jgi:hypothetical protein